MAGRRFSLTRWKQILGRSDAIDEAIDSVFDKHFDLQQTFAGSLGGAIIVGVGLRLAMRRLLGQPRRLDERLAK